MLRADHGGTGELIWSPASNRFGWTSYLGGAPGAEHAPQYADRLRAAGVPCDLVVVPGMYHGADDLPARPTARR